MVDACVAMLRESALEAGGAAFAVALPWTSQPAPVPKEASRFTLLLFNVYWLNHKLGDVRQMIEETNADIVVLVETTSRVRNAIVTVLVLGAAGLLRGRRGQQLARSGGGVDVAVAHGGQGDGREVEGVQEVQALHQLEAHQPAEECREEDAAEDVESFQVHEDYLAQEPAGLKTVLAGRRKLHHGLEL